MFQSCHMVQADRQTFHWAFHGILRSLHRWNQVSPGPFSAVIVTATKHSTRCWRSKKTAEASGNWRRLTSVLNTQRNQRFKWCTSECSSSNPKSTIQKESTNHSMIYWFTILIFSILPETSRHPLASTWWHLLSIGFRYSASWWSWHGSNWWNKMVCCKQVGVFC